MPQTMSYEEAVAYMTARHKYGIKLGNDRFLAVLELGLGGRLDATNVCSPNACVITNIGLDHTHILGDTHAKIAREKAGIIKPGVPLITATEQPSAFAVIERIAAEEGAPLIT